jgi:hypothetical protein
MDTCAHYQELIWEDLFGLLEAGDSANLRRHMAGCSSCQAERATAAARHQLLAEAARLDVEIPPFAAPVFEDTRPRPPLDLSEVRAAKRRIPIRPWLIAAAVLLLIGFPVGFYRYGRLRCEAALQAAEESVAQIVKERGALHSQAETDRQNLPLIARGTHFRLQAIGPAAYQPGAVNPYRVFVTDLEGHPRDVPVTARLLDAGKPVILETKKPPRTGEMLVMLPANLPLAPQDTPCLELTAQSQNDLAPLHAYLRVLEPAYRTHLAIDKPVYHVGDSIYFRSLTLERFGLKTPGREFTAVYTLASAGGKEFQTLRGLTRKDGIGGGEFVFSPNWPAGEYTLTVAEAENHFPPVTRRLLVRSTVSNQLKAAPATSDKVEVEFFPEGGDLVADLDNRVYFRVHTPPGQAADGKGIIVDSHGREVVAVSTVPSKGPSAPNSGLGMFTLRPRAGETYQLCLPSPQGRELRAALPPVQATGVVLSLPAAVGGPDEPVRVLLHRTGPERDLLVALFCQGRLLGQEFVASKSATTELRLAPTVPCAGVLRVTVFEERQGQLRPVAERLAYRRPKEQLVLLVKTDKKSYVPGESVRLDIGSRNENGKPEPAWVLVSVVDQAAFSRSKNPGESSLPAYFHLSSELEQPEDLEQADILLGDSSEAAAALDLFLGTQGWRRFAEPEKDKTLVLANAPAPRRAQNLTEPAIVKLDNREQIERKCALSLEQALTKLGDTVSRRDEDLVKQGKERLEAAQMAAQQLDVYEDRARALLQLGVGFGGVALFAAACILLAVALVRLGRGLAGNRAYLGGAFAALLLCALAVWGPTHGWNHASNPADRSVIAQYAKKLDQRLDLPVLALENHPGTAVSQALFKGRGPFPQESSRKSLATLGPNEEPNAGQQSQKPVPGPPTQRPFLGTIRGGPSSKPPVPEPPNKSPLAHPLPVRAYAYLPPKEPGSSQQIPETIMWQPILFAENGTAEVRFTLPSHAAAYRIQVQGHSAAGRLGAAQETVECRENSAGATK